MEFRDLIEVLASIVNVDAALIIDVFNLDSLIPSVGATAVSS